MPRRRGSPRPAPPPPIERATRSLPPPLPADKVPSLSVVEEVLRHEEESYRDKANSLNASAGIIISAAGVIVALVGAEASTAGLVGQIAAIVAGIGAVLALLSHADKTIEPRSLRDGYLQADDITTRIIVLNTRIPLHERNERRLIEKARRLKGSACILLLSAAAIAVGGIVDRVGA